MRSLVVAWLALVASAAQGAPRAAIVIASPTGPGAARVDALRSDLAARYALETDPQRRAVLETFAPPPDPRAEARVALETARQRMQKLDLPAVARALDDAWAAASRLPPTSDARTLLVSVETRRAELALATRDPASLRLALRAALSLDPTLRLDPDHAAPPLVRALDDARRARAAARKVTIDVRSEPLGAQVIESAEARGMTPLTLSLPEGPNVLWLASEGREPRAELVDPAHELAPIALQELGVAQRIGPLVEAVREGGVGRARAAAALGDALGVDDVLVIGADASVHTYAVRGAATSSPSEKPWYRRGWVWGVVAGGAVVVGGAIALGVVFGTRSRTSAETVVTCCQ